MKTKPLVAIFLVVALVTGFSVHIVEYHIRREGHSLGPKLSVINSNST